MPQKQEEKCEANSRSQRQQIAAKILWPQLAHEKQRHPGDAGYYGREIAHAKLFFIEDRFKYQHVNGRRVLQKNRVGGRRQLGSQHEEQKQRRVQN